LAQAVENAAAAICITDVQGRLLFANQSFLSAYGIDRGDVLGQPLSALHGAGLTPELSDLEALPRRSRAWSGPLVGLRPDGTQFPLILSISTIADGSGSPFGWFGMVIDISSNDAANRVAAEATSEPQDATRRIFHDLNNKLAGILMNVSLAKTYGNCDAKQTARLQRAEDAALRAKDLVEQLRGPSPPAGDPDVETGRAGERHG